MQTAKGFGVGQAITANDGPLGAEIPQVSSAATVIEPCFNPPQLFALRGRAANSVRTKQHSDVSRGRVYATYRSDGCGHSIRCGRRNRAACVLASRSREDAT